MLKTTVIILAAGQGLRMKLGYNKLFFKFHKTILSITIEAFEKSDDINDIVIVAKDEEVERIKQILEDNKFKKAKQVVIGGETRQDSCRNGVEAVKEESDIIMIHDGARPFVTSDVIKNSIEDAIKHEVSVVGVPSKNTIKVVDENGFVVETLDRSKLWEIQTPQTFKAEIIRKVHDAAVEDRFIGTDDTCLAERLGYKVKLTMGDYSNIKITTPEDLDIAEKILAIGGEN